MEAKIAELREKPEFNGLKPDGSPYSVLIVDDALYVRKILNKVLQGVGYRIVGEASNGKEGVDMYLEDSCDCVIMDITMPIMDGIGATKAIIEKDDRAVVLIFSAISSLKSVKDAMSTGASGFLVKPLKAATVESILGSIKKILIRKYESSEINNQ